ncbi:MAG: hypothetical protein PHX83_17860, partial [Acidobacteriia bacterium]|nr:hypothetical protein [Terriglobia bacterium]
MVLKKPDRHKTLWLCAGILAALLWWCVTPHWAGTVTSVHRVLQQEHAGESASAEPLWKEALLKWINFAILFGGLAFLLRKPL